MKGICKLCQIDTDLCKSHIIPEWGYKGIYSYKHQNNRRLPTIKVQKGAELELSNMQKGIREDLLCSSCENKLSVWEKYVYELLNREIDNIDTEFYRIKVDYKKFRLFQLSVLWRCAITSNKILHLELGNKHIERLRLMLITEDPGKEWQYPCLLFLLKLDNSPVKDLLYASEGNRIEGFRQYNIFYNGILWNYLVGSSTHRLKSLEKENAFLQKDGTLTIDTKQLPDIGHQMSMIKEIYG